MTPSRARGDGAGVDGPQGRGTVLAGARWMTISQTAAVVTQVGSSLVLARLLDPAEFGLVALVMLVPLFIQRVFKDLGTGSALVHRPEVSPQLLSSVFYLNVGWGLVATTTVCAFAAPLAWLLGDSEAVPLLRVASLTFVLSSVGLVPAAVVRRRLEYGRLAVLNYLGFAGGLLLAVALAAAGLGAWSMVIGGIAGTAFGSAYAWGCARWRPLWHFDRADIRQISDYSVNLTGFNLAVYFTSQGDRLIIGRFLGTAALGYYSLATRLFLTPIAVFSTVFTEVLFPALSRVQEDRRTVGSTVLRATALGTFAFAPLLVGLSVTAGPLVQVALGDQWLPAVPLVSILALVGLVQVVQTNNTTIFRSVGRTDLMMRWGILTAVATMTGYIAGLPWGTEGVATGYLISALVVAYPLHYMAFHLVDLRVSALFRAIAPYLGASGVMAVLVLGARAWMQASDAAPAVELAGAVLVGVASYAAIMIVLRPPAIGDALRFVQLKRGVSSAVDVAPATTTPP